MTISLDKALLWALPYLYFISVLYYLGFWGPFDINAFNFYDVSDLLKGVIAPLGGSFAFSLFISVIQILPSRIAYAMANSKLLLIHVLIVIIGLLGIISWYFLIKDMLHSEKIIYTTAFPMSDTKSALSTAASGVIVYIISFYLDNYYLSDKPFLIRCIRFTSINFILFLPINAYIIGAQHSRFIKQDKVFDYIVTDGSTVPKSIYKYLGKAGNYQILLTLNNRKCIIVATDKLSPIGIERFMANDSVSVAQFKAHKKFLARVPRIILPAAEPEL